MKLPRFLRPNPITIKRLQRFRKIKRGYYSLLLLVFLTFLSLFSEYLANNRAIVINFDGKMYFPTWKFIPMSEFHMADQYGFDDSQVDYRLLQRMMHWATIEDEDERWDEIVAYVNHFHPSAFEYEYDLDEIIHDHFVGKKMWMFMPPIRFNPLENDLSYESPPPNPPDNRHILGTDSQGRDVAARLIYGFRISIFFALALTFVAQFIGTLIGSMQGFLGGRFDILSQRIIEIWSNLPFLYVVILMAVFIRPNFWTLLLVMAFFQWIGITYYMRTEMYREKAREYCLAAKSIGASRLRIVFKHLLPNCLTPLVTFTPFAIVGAISALTALDYLGYGLPPPTPSWGEMIQQALAPGNRDKLWLVFSPFTALTITLLLVTLIGESIREAFDPKQYAKFK